MENQLKTSRAFLQLLQTQENSRENYLPSDDEGGEALWKTGSRCVGQLWVVGRGEGMVIVVNTIYNSEPIKLPPCCITLNSLNSLRFNHLFLLLKTTLFIQKPIYSRIITHAFLTSFYLSTLYLIIYQIFPYTSTRDLFTRKT